MEENTKESGKMENNMERASSIMHITVNGEKEYGMTERE